MKASVIGKWIGRVVLLAVLPTAVLPAGLRAQDRWGEIGISGMALSVDREMVAWPGFVLNVGAWRKGYALEGYALFFLYLPIGAGGNIIVTPFRAAKVIPYFAVGGMVGAVLFDEGTWTMLNAGFGLKVPFSPHSGLRAEYRVLYLHDDEEWQTGSGLILNIYASFGRRTGPRIRY